jgi:uncharacterized protein YggE
MRILLRRCIIAALAWTVTTTAAAQPAGLIPPFSLRVAGDATIAARPDQAELDAVVMTRAETAQSAASANATATTRVLTEMKQRFGSSSTITTMAYSLRPEYRFPREGEQPQIAGYIATNTVHVVTPDLDRVGAIVDAAIAAGSSRIEGLQFTLKDRQAVYLDALRQAAMRARQEADALAAALGLTVSRVLTASEEAAVVRPFVDAVATARLAAESAPTPVEPATIDVHAGVSLVVEVSGQR